MTLVEHFPSKSAFLACIGFSILVARVHTVPYATVCSVALQIRGVLGNKYAGQHNLKTVHFREILASGNILAWLSAVCVFFCSTLSTLGRQRRAFM